MPSLTRIKANHNGGRQIWGLFLFLLRAIATFAGAIALVLQSNQPSERFDIRPVRPTSIKRPPVVGGFLLPFFMSWKAKISSPHSSSVW